MQESVRSGLSEKVLRYICYSVKNKIKHQHLANVISDSEV